MGILDFLRRKSVYKLRKNYDKLREKIDKFSSIERRIEMLRLLDQIEPQLVSLEEHYMSKFEKRKMYSIVDAGIRKVKFVLEEEKRKIKK